MEIRHYYDENNAKQNIIKAFREINVPKDSTFICIGTDRSTGDSFGPMVGNHLNSSVKYIGDIHDTVNAQNIDRARDIKYPTVAIDAGLGKTSSVGAIIVEDKPMHPGTGADKEIDKIGNFSITGIVNVKSHMNYLVLQSTKLSIVMNMAKVLANSIIEYVNE